MGQHIWEKSPKTNELEHRNKERLSQASKKWDVHPNPNPACCCNARRVNKPTHSSCRRDCLQSSSGGKDESSLWSKNLRWHKGKCNKDPREIFREFESTSHQEVSLLMLEARCKLFFFLWTETKRCPVISPTKVNCVHQTHHETILRTCTTTRTIDQDTDQWNSEHRDAASVRPLNPPLTARSTSWFDLLQCFTFYESVCELTETFVKTS